MYSIFNFSYINSKGVKFLVDHLNGLKKKETLKDFVSSSFNFQKPISENEETPIFQFINNDDKFELLYSDDKYMSRKFSCYIVNNVPSIINHFIKLHNNVEYEFLNDKHHSFLYLYFILNNNICLESNEFTLCIKECYNEFKKGKLGFRYQKHLYKYIECNFNKNKDIQALSSLLNIENQKTLLNKLL